MGLVRKADDAFGTALVEHLEGRSGADLLLEIDDGLITPAMAPAEFFLEEAAWPAEERRILGHAEPGPVLDLGAGAGRHSLHFQALGHDVTAVDVSPGAVEVCRARGVADVRLADLTDPPADKPWMTVLLMCGNLGLAGGWDETRALLRRLATVCGPGAVLIADSVDATLMGDEHSVAYARRNTERDLPVGQVRLRLRYGPATTPWFDLLTVPIPDVRPLVQGTGWELEAHLVDTVDHYLALRRT